MVITPCCNSESNHSHNSIKLPLAPHHYFSLPFSFLISLGGTVNSCKHKFASQMVQCFFCYQVVDLFQASSVLSAPAIHTTPCYLQQDCLQFIRSQIICHSVFLSCVCWIICVELGWLVAQNTYILIEEAK